MARVLFPKAKIIAIEPARATFEKLKFFSTWFIDCFQFALGDGKPVCIHDRGHLGLNRFYTEAERNWWPKDSYTVPRFPLGEIVNKFGMAAPCIVKIDCEGGERHLLSDSHSVPILKQAVQICMEIHPGFGGEPDEWADWLKAFEDSHDFLIGGWCQGKRRYVYAPAPIGFARHNMCQIQLLSKEWS